MGVIMRNLLLILLLFFLGCAESINKVNVSDNFKIHNSATLAILNFKTTGLPSNIGEKVAEKFSVEIVQTKKFKIIDRSNINKIFEEIGFQGNLDTLGGLDEKSKIKIRQLGAQYFMSGTVFSFEEKRRYDDNLVLFSKVHITAKIINIETGEVVWGAERMKDSKAINAGDRKPKSLMKVEIAAKSADKLLDEIISEMTENILKQLKNDK